MHTVKWFQVLLYNSHNLTLVISLHTVCSTRSIDRILSGAITPGQSGFWSNGNEGVLHIPQISKAGGSPSDCLLSYLGHPLGASLTRRQICNQCILHPQQTKLKNPEQNHDAPRN